MLVFAVETSCDETSVCLINNKNDILSHITYSQKEHELFGGVIPELASRSHLQILQKISRKAIHEANISLSDIDLFTATVGPGLIGGLLVGSIFTKALAIGSNKPFVPINHLEGHLLSPTYNNSMQYPYLAFLLTGGHTQIYIVNGINNYELIGQTLDDAIGEAFDKVAKLLELSYPGGPKIELLAKKGDENKFMIPHPLKKSKSLNFSFSGIKTAINLITKENDINKNNFKSDIAASFQKIVNEILERKFKLCINYLNNKKIIVKQLALVGGVASNNNIYLKMKEVAKSNACSIVLPPKNMLSDNAAMIGWACIQKYNIEKFSDIHFKANPRLKLIGKEL